MGESIVIMGVAGCGKSSLAQVLSQALGCVLIEGDDFHSAQSRAKMARGVALTDADRAGWLAALGLALQQHPDGAVLTCSALKKAYRDHLRASVATLRFVFLDLDQAEAQRRVTARAATHFFSATLVENQFATLESPVGEARVLRVDATAALDQLCAQVLQWLDAPSRQP